MMFGMHVQQQIANLRHTLTSTQREKLNYLMYLCNCL